VDFGERVWTAHVDGWEAEGRARAGATRVAGARLMCSGLPEIQWNGAWATELPVDLPAAARWFAERGCPWGIGVPRWLDYAPGEHLASLRLMGLEPSAFAPCDWPDGVLVRRAASSDVALLARLDAAAFGGDDSLTERWIGAVVGVVGFSHWIAQADGQAVGLITASRTDFDAGPCGTITGVGVLPPFRGRGIGAALTSHACADLLERGATLVQLSPNTDTAARVYARLGFREVLGLNIYRPSSVDRLPSTVDRQS
jgi:ribosomal protein S18 acetylase RimI-like enzyme